MFGGFVARGQASQKPDERLFGRSKQGTGSGPKVVRETYREWSIEVTHRQVGLAVARDQYSAAIFPSAGRKEFLSGFTSSTAAFTAAKARIDKRIDVAARRLQGPHGYVRKKR